MSRCRSCNADVMFVPSELGRTMCLNAVPDTNRGNVRIQTTSDGKQIARVLNKHHAERMRATSMEALYLSHHATCVDAARWTRSKQSSTGVNSGHR